VAGVPCELHVYPGAPLGFPMAWRAGVTRDFERDGLAALRRALADHGPRTGKPGGDLTPAGRS
jgi:hypothetical protein